MTGSSSTRAELLRLLRQAGGSTLRDLVRATGLSPSALRQQLTVLERDGLIHAALVRGRPGRPPLLYRIGPGDAGTPRSYAALVTALLHAVGAQDSRQLQRTAERAAARIAADHSRVTGIADFEDRIRAALDVLLDAAVPAQLTRRGEAYEITVPACALAPLAAESPVLCAITRRLLASLVGAEVEQRESILWGNPRCLFVLTTPRHRPSVAMGDVVTGDDGSGNGRRALG